MATTDTLVRPDRAPVDPATPLLRVRDLTVQFPAGRKQWVTAVDGVSFDVAAGESVALVGESGSGKTVSSLAVMGLTGDTGGRIARGSVEFDGLDLTKQPHKQWQGLRGTGMGMIFQQPIRSLNPAYTVGDQIAESVRKHLGLDRKAAMARAVEMLELVQIPRAADRVREYPHAFSGGMCQRVMIAMVMACNPRLLIADEPTTALDVTVQETILDLLRDLQEQTGISLLFVTHDLGVVAELCERVVVMYAGEVIEDGRADEVFFTPQHPYTSGLLASIPRPGISNDRRLTAIPGRIPAAGEWPAGCHFHDRCTHARSGLCDTTHPTLAETAPGRAARCLRVADLQLEGVSAS
ncbi:ABC transporter ATP-binding protein [Prescottella equi]|uniref:Oligopeptide/dipeptide ABC transporter ATPase subunit n=1 Tax=Rhodococcus hoagii (strain 103S) TaxID=685727 RepID=A0A3S5YCF9_RHOH1|nr:ABC transporter ATP-binding protein [Prescottella equi]NKS63528.1 ATP-binding cassette domain-containing protein [Prescottella equi]NKZ89231.1 ATP-binding cassette domain-containing protein [Prescottella equi]ORM08073.1 peptide ABC transporter ATP-binding protein [Prescottella equi]CBH50273.1 putative oligopeptide/dipeptide ABC transporter ATPase subunit [Prescottella equi 103S]